MPLNMHMNMHDQGPGMVSGMQPGLLQEAPGVPPKQQQKPRTSLGGAGHLPPLQQPPHKQQQQQPATPGFSWASVGEALQGFGEGAVDSLGWEDLGDFDLPDLKQHEVDDLLNF
jgi:hypothetical protein